MELKPGYKLTEVGVIPEDWGVFTIGKTVTLVNGRAFKPSDWKTHGLPIIRIQNLNDPMASYNYYEGDVEERYYVNNGDILFAWSGTKESSFGARMWRGQTAILNQHIFRVIPNEAKLSSQYVLLALKRFQEDIERKSHGFKSSFVHIRKSDLESTFLAVPPLPEQRSIATVLSDMDALLRSLDQLIAKKRDLKQATMQQLLTGKKRLPGFGEGKGYKQTQVGVIPEDWDWCQISKVSIGHKQGYYTKDRYVENGTQLVRITDLYNPRIDFEAMPMLHISDKDFEQYKISKGDFLFARSGAIGRYGIVNEDINAIFGSYIIRFNFDRNKLLNNFFGYLFETQMIWRQLLSITQGSSNININAGNIKALTIPLPDTEEQHTIATVLSDMDTELVALEQRRDKTRALKQGMMQELLTGRTRLL